MSHVRSSMKIFVLSLPSDTERRARLAQQLRSLNLEFEIFDAVDGRAGLTAEHYDLVDFEYAASRLGRKMGNGEAACAISHSLIYEKIVADRHPWAIILEDDVTVDENLVTLISSGVYKAYNLLLLNHRFSYVWRLSKRHLFGPFFTYRLLLPCWMTAGYVISREAAAYLLSHSRPVKFTADWPGDITEIAACVCNPVLVEHPDVTDHRSNLATERWKVIDRTRFFKRSYWRRWIRKRLSTRIA